MFQLNNLQKFTSSQSLPLVSSPIRIMFDFAKSKFRLSTTTTTTTKILTIFILLLLTSDWFAKPIEAKCPSREQSFCLQVDGFDTIVLDGDKFADLRNIFERIAFLFEDSGETTEVDQLLLLNNHAIRELRENAFGDFRFRRITIQNCTNLDRLHARAFHGTRGTLRTLKFDSIAVGNATQEDFFEALNTLERLEELELRNHRVHKIRAYTFRQRALARLHLDGPLDLLDNNAFFYLDGVRIIRLAKRISRINQHAFDFKIPSNLSVDIYLDAKLGYIEPRTFTYATRPLTINLYFGKLKRFDRAIFAPILAAPLAHEIIFHGSPKMLTDPCQLLWLFRQKFRGVVTFKDEPLINERYFDLWQCSTRAQSPTSPTHSNIDDRTNEDDEDGGGDSFQNRVPIDTIDSINRAGIDATMTHNNSGTKFDSQNRFLLLLSMSVTAVALIRSHR